MYLCNMKRRRIKKYQILQVIIIIFATGFIMGLLAAGGAKILSLKFSLVAIFGTVTSSYFLLQTIRPLRYKALVITRRQRDKAMRKAEELKSKRIIVQNFNNP